MKKLNYCIPRRPKRASKRIFRSSIYLENLTEISLLIINLIHSFSIHDRFLWRGNFHSIVWDTKFINLSPAGAANRELAILVDFLFQLLSGYLRFCVENILSTCCYDFVCALRTRVPIMEGVSGLRNGLFYIRDQHSKVALNTIFC